MQMYMLMKNKKVVGSPDGSVTANCLPLDWKLNSGLLQVHYVVLNPSQSLQ